MRDLAFLGISSVEELATRTHTELYARLNVQYKKERAAGKYVGVAGLGPELDACVLDTLECAIAQARDPVLPAEQCKWWCVLALRCICACLRLVIGPGGIAAEERQKPSLEELWHLAL